MSLENGKPFGAIGKYRGFTETEEKPFGAHKYISLNGDRKAVELKGVLIGYSVLYKNAKGETVSIDYEV